MQHMQPQHTFKHHRVHWIIIRINAILQVCGTGSVQDFKPLLPFKMLVNTRNSLSSQNPNYYFFLSENCMLLETWECGYYHCLSPTIVSWNICLLVELQSKDKSGMQSNLNTHTNWHLPTAYWQNSAKFILSARFWMWRANFPTITKIFPLKWVVLMAPWNQT